MIKDTDWKAIEEAAKILLKSSQINKLEGKGWMIYKVGYIIRIDLKDTQ